MSETINMFFDMDGVLAVYSREDYVPPTTWDLPGSHYFLDRPIDGRAQAMFDVAAARTDCEVWIISSLDTPPAIWFEQMRDKVSWARERFDIETDRTLITRDSKAVLVRSVLGRRLRPTDVLVDDFNPNLVRWANAGGTAIKYLNGINSAESWNGPIVMADRAAKLMRMLTIQDLESNGAEDAAHSLL